MNDNKMWALVKESAAPGLALKRVEIPEVGTNDVKIKIHKTLSAVQTYIFYSGMNGLSTPSLLVRPLVTNMLVKS